MAMVMAMAMNDDRENPAQRRSKYDMGSINPSPYEVHCKTLKNVGSKKRVLEIGCSTGYFSEALKKQENWVYGIELDGAAAAISKSICHELYAGSILDINPTVFAGHYFDAIVMLDVLEHIVDTEVTLKLIHKIMQPKTELFLCVPNIGHFMSRFNILLGRFDYETYGLMDKGHVRFFTPKSATDVLQACGFSVVQIIGIPAFWVYNNLGARVLRKIGILGPVLHRLALIWPALFGYQILVRAIKNPTNGSHP